MILLINQKLSEIEIILKIIWNNVKSTQFLLVSHTDNEF